MQKIYLILFLLLPLSLLAQRPEPNQQKPATQIPGTFNNNAPKGNTKISGTVVDDSSGEPVEFASVSLINKKDNRPVDGTITSDKGKFTLNNIAEGNYKLAVTFVSYETIFIDPVDANGKSNIDLGNIKLKADIKMLEEIVVEDKRDLIEDKIDRIVYNAEQDLTNSGGDASDVLRKVPMLSVDLDGNVQMRGNGNIRVLINNKPSSIMAGSVADALKQIPADMIKSVEVITSPSAKYDAEGTAGIINIITKKNTMQGLSGNINLNGGNRGSNISGNLNYRWKKFGLALSTNGRAYYSPFEQTTFRQNFTESGNLVSEIDQFNSGKSFGIFGNTQLGFDYDINQTNVITGGVRVGYRTRDQGNLLVSSFNNAENNSTSSFIRDFDNGNSFNTIDANLDYIKTFKKPKQELNILTLYSYGSGLQDFNVNQFNSQNVLSVREKSDNNSFNEEITLQIDYTHPFSDLFQLETGAKGIVRTVGSDFKFFNYNFDQQAFTLAPNRSNEFNYGQDVWASYVNFRYITASKWGFQAGLRYEATNIEGNFITDETGFTQIYDNWIPSVVVSRDFKDGSKIKVSYNKRIQRPSISFLNPFVNYSDSLNISFGNPELLPELTNSYELSYSIFKRKFSVNSSLYWQQTNDVITSVQSIGENGVSTTTFQNIASNDRIGVSVFGSYNPNKKLRISANFNVYYTTFNAPGFENPNSNSAYDMNLNASYDFGKGWSAQTFGFFRSRSVELQGLRGAFSFYTMGVKKEIFKDKGAITVGINNPFANALKIRSNFSDTTFRSADVRSVFIRSYRIGFEYKFGNSNSRSRRSKRGVDNNDTKQRESNEQ
jgi:outer membrane receptor protein involved in Fe transport